MTNEEIKLEKENLYAQISVAKTKLEELQNICKHEETVNGIYSFRPGHSESATFCKFCDKLINQRPWKTI